METRESGWERFIYVALCILSVGSVYFARIILSEAIRKAFKED